MHRFQIRTLSFVLSAAATLMAGQSKTLAELTQESPLIVVGRVAAADSYVGADGEIYTDVAIRAESVLKDSEETGRADLRFTVKGGTVGDRVVTFSDVPRFENDEDVVVFGTADRPLEKYRLEPTRGRDIIYRIQQSRGDAGEAISEKEMDRAREFLRTVETGTRDRGGVIELGAVSCSAYTGVKWAEPATTYLAGPNLPAAWGAVLQAAAQSWTGAGSKFGFTTSPSSPHIISLGDLGAGSTLASTRSEYSVATKQMVRFSMTFNNRFTWTTTGEAGKFDVQAIATHELGHALGLNHPADTACSEETMWASAGSGETKKRSLEAGDKAGVATLYGSATSVAPPPATPPPPAVPTAPVLTYFSLVTTRAVATKPLVILTQGSNIDPAKVQGFFTGGACGTAGCVALPYGASTTDVVFINTLPAGAYTLALRNSATGALSAVRTFTVNAN